MRAKRKKETEKSERGWGKAETFQSGEEEETLWQLFPQRRRENLFAVLHRIWSPKLKSGYPFWKSEQSLNQEAVDIMQTRACADVILKNLAL